MADTGTFQPGSRFADRFGRIAEIGAEGDGDFYRIILHT